MDSPVINTLSLFSGIGMFDEGVRAGLDLLGFRTNVLAFCERDPYAATTLLARMESQAMEPAPVWCGDIREFPAKEFHGLVDLITAGFPCQDLSIAGQRAGLDGARSGLFYEILRIADDCDAQIVMLENVPGIVSAGVTIVDEAEGELTERAVARVVGELADSGFDAEWLHLRASDVGAAHRRERWFCLAWRREMLGAGCEIMADTLRPGRQQIARGAPGDEGAHEGRATKTDHEPVGADAGRELFAPSPADPRWSGIIAETPWLAPATQPGICRLADGLSHRVDEHRADRLRCIGNGVVAAQAAAAFVELMRRMTP